jgi:hypothetical protein
MGVLFANKPTFALVPPLFFQLRKKSSLGLALCLAQPHPFFSSFFLGFMGSNQYGFPFHQFP